MKYYLILYMDCFINFVSKQYNWTNEYVTKVGFEYERFMNIKSRNNNAFPSNHILKFWKIHVLFTELYHNYCMSNFNTFIHFNPSDYEDIYKNKIIETLNLYISLYNKIENQDVWYYFIKTNINEFIVNNNDYPVYTNIPNIISIYFNYGKYNKQTIQLSNDIYDIGKLKDMIQTELQIDRNLINITYHKDIKLSIFDNHLLFNGYFKDNILLSVLKSKNINFLIVEINL